MKPKGTKDLFKSDLDKRAFIKQRLITTYEKYSYEPLETPAFEKSDTFNNLYGEESDKLIFRILKRGEDLSVALQKNLPLHDLCLRYDQTASLARIYSEYEMPHVYKRYSIQPVWRADRPQKGRFREFTQCDVDIVGSNSILADVEILMVALECLDSLGIKDFTIKINHRGLIESLLDSYGVENKYKVLMVLDKIDLESPDAFLSLKPYIQDLDGFKKELEQPLQLLENNDSSKYLLDLINLCGDSRVKYDPFLVRGLSYYTGFVFEIETPGFNGSIAGGGRYNNLIKNKKKEYLPAAGFSFGLDRLELLVETNNQQIKDFEDKVMICHLVSPDKELNIYKNLLSQGVKVYQYLKADKLSEQLKYASKNQFRYVIIVGSDEIKQDKVSIKDLKLKKQVCVETSRLLKN